MARVTEQYGIDGDVPFVNVHVERDNLVFVDPSAIRNDHSSRGRAAYGQLQTMFGQVVDAARSNKPAEHAAGRELLKHLHEPNETRLGMSVHGLKGRGFGEELSSRFWDELRVNRACRHAALNRLEDTRIFLEHVGNDRISDMTTRIIFNVLADFTAEMMECYPALHAGSSTADSDTWSNDIGWQKRPFELPHIAGKQLLLVPRNWVYWRTLMEPVQFYNRFSTQVIQDESAVRDKEGKIKKKPKQNIKREHPLVRPLNNDKAVEYKEKHGRDLVGEYRSFVDNTFEAMSPEDIASRTAGGQ
ncbi:hypothetical protein [Mycobacteroides abscessus]|uniref:hypothetical protein n=1 Tax=Mycobacteroides abscessus TaxID=36809 RepID=UPI000AEF8F41|nr:hypothetical protein [Mycobacteroides abscessus]